MSRKRTHKLEKLARIYDAEILPVWAHRFGRLLMRDLEIPEQAQVLDVACGTGFPTTEIVGRLSENSRLIAIDGSASMLDVARKKIEAMGAKNVYFRTEAAIPKLSFADDVYDLVVCNLGLGEFTGPEAALAEFVRVAKPGGEVRCTLPLRGSFQEFYDIYNEVLVKHDKHETHAALQEYIESTLCLPEDLEGWMRSTGLEETSIEVDEFTMLFKSSREFFFAPVIEYGPLSDWKAIAGKGQEMQNVFWYIKESIDAYYGERAFEVTVKAGLLRGRKPTQSSGNNEITVDVSLDVPKDPFARPTLSIDDDVELDAFIEGSERPEDL